MHVLRIPKTGFPSLREINSRPLDSTRARVQDLDKRLAVVPGGDGEEGASLVDTGC